MQFVLHALEHAFEDTLKMVPFLFVAYWVIEYIERRHSRRIEQVLAGGGRFGFLPAAALGLVPQCGFSAMAANLYAGRVITLGTLLAVFLSTSDEAVPLLLAMPDRWYAMVLLLAVKLITAILAALVIDALPRAWLPPALRGGYSGSSHDVACHEHHETNSIWRAAFKHTVQITVFIFLFNLALEVLVEGAGEEFLGELLLQSGTAQPFLAALIGLIPNCISSVLITQLFAAGQLSFGACVAGLCSAAGVGLVVLLRTNRSWKQNGLIILLLYGWAVLAGLVCTFFAGIFPIG